MSSPDGLNVVGVTEGIAGRPSLDAIPSYVTNFGSIRPNSTPRYSISCASATTSMSAWSTCLSAIIALTVALSSSGTRTRISPSHSSMDAYSLKRRNSRTARIARSF
jgi:hypothetical protein